MRWENCYRKGPILVNTQMNKFNKKSAKFLLNYTVMMSMSKLTSKVVLWLYRSIYQYYHLISLKMFKSTHSLKEISQRKTCFQMSSHFLCLTCKGKDLKACPYQQVHLKKKFQFKSSKRSQCSHQLIQKLNQLVN